MSRRRIILMVDIRELSVHKFFNNAKVIRFWNHASWEVHTELLQIANISHFSQKNLVMDIEMRNRKIIGVAKFSFITQIRPLYQWSRGRSYEYGTVTCRRELGVQKWTGKMPLLFLDYLVVMAWCPDPSEVTGPASVLIGSICEKCPMYDDNSIT